MANNRASPGEALAEAVALQKAGRTGEAEAACRAVLAGDPGNAEALHLSGILALQRRDFAAALDFLSRAVAGRPDAAAFHAALGNALHASGRVAEAIASYRRALAIEPDLPGTLVNLAALLAAQRAPDEAIAAYRKALALKPDDAAAHFNLANLLLQRRDLAQAAEGYTRALALEPDYAEAYGNLGVALKQQGKLEEAIAAYRKALAVKPDFADAHFNLGIVLQSLKRYDETLDCFRSALRLRPKDARIFANLVNVSAQACAWDDWEEHRRRLTELVRAGAPVNPFHFVTASGEPQDQLACARRYAQTLVPAPLPPLWRGQTYAKDKIRIGYLSAGLGEHTTAHLIAELFERHDRGRFEIFGLSLGADDRSPMRRRIEKAFDRFADVRAQGNAEVARTIRDLGVGVAVDLDGYTTAVRAETAGRAAILAHRPAPVQVNYLGYPGTMGADFIDYILVDPFVAPSDQQPFFAEKLVHLPDCYQVNDTKREIAAAAPSRRACGLPDDSFVFCCFNNNYKITPPMFDVWMGLLAAVPGSVLWLLADNDAAVRNLRREAGLRGADPARLVFAPRLPSAEHLARHRLADLFLDTLPCNAHTTASDSLWAGLPVLTCTGKTMAGRVAGSLLTAVGLPELVTHRIEDYEARALRLARERDVLRGIRAKLERSRATAPLFDIERTRRHIEAAYVKMWEIFQSGGAPRAFAVAPIAA